jgi:hypothetical protein
VPRVSFMMVRAALLHLGIGATLGGWLLVEKGLQLSPWIWMWRPAHIQMMLLGWIVQLACGVAVWILPRLDAAGNRGSLWLAWFGFGALNAGVVLAAVHAPLAGWIAPDYLGWMLPLAALAYCLAIGAIALHAWRRVLPFGAGLSQHQ